MKQAKQKLEEKQFVSRDPEADWQRFQSVAQQMVTTPKKQPKAWPVREPKTSKQE